MISVKEASQLVQNVSLEYAQETISIDEAVGRVLDESVSADRDLPPYNRIKMDGIAYSFDSYQQGNRTFKLQSEQFAGEPPHTLKTSKHCIQVMTGAVLPNGCDIVTRIEDVKITKTHDEYYAVIEDEQAYCMQNIHLQGADSAKGQVLIKQGQLISAAEIAILASVGKAYVKVKKHPKTAVISTGNELVPIKENPLPHQIRRSNTITLASLLMQKGIETSIFHIQDNADVLYQTFKKLINDYDMLLITGGVSKGKTDFIPHILKTLDVTKVFHGVLQRPGKPFWFGTHKKCIVFALPGNPLSSFCCTLRYVIPFLFPKKQLFHYAQLAEEVVFKPQLTCFLPVRLAYDKTQLLAYPVYGNGSGDFRCLTNADAFMELPNSKTVFENGSCHKIWQFR